LDEARDPRWGQLTLVVVVVMRMDVLMNVLMDVLVVVSVVSITIASLKGLPLLLRSTAPAESTKQAMPMLPRPSHLVLDSIDRGTLIVVLASLAVLIAVEVRASALLDSLLAVQTTEVESLNVDQ
jgi:hypothetical protein